MSRISPALAAGLGPFLLGLALAAASHPTIAALVGSGAASRPLPVSRLAELALHHLTLAAAGLAVVSILGVGLGLFATRTRFASFRGSIDTVVAFAQAVPPVVVVALALPVLGFGGPPTLLALLAYGIMPTLRGTVGALDSVSNEARESAQAIGLTPGQILAYVELPLAAKGLVETLRTALILAVSVTAVGALAGASTLGTPIVAGLQNQNIAAMLQGALATAALAFLGDGLLLAIGGWVQGNRQRTAD
ncbi:ABC transporter permease [Methylobacterium sp. R2-1]|uniref:ABC transporter permease n=1 Tax=Methylobacterium sp. R2-1 TaxID=2587064 RepID=UPI00160A3C14|nr:ABC transporter permease subunit [Methylobacterium sp. R2-1]MBB2961589.1 osmoprotectant transport system permease protein [Methylobacterium sp. R2-1]